MRKNCFHLETTVLILDKQLILLCMWAEMHRTVWLKIYFHIFMQQLSIQLTTKQSSRPRPSANSTVKKRARQSWRSRPEIFVTNVSVSAWNRRKTKVFHGEFCETFEEIDIPVRSTSRVLEAKPFWLGTWPLVWATISGGCTPNAPSILAANTSIYHNVCSPTGWNSCSLERESIRSNALLIWHSPSIYGQDSNDLNGKWRHHLPGLVHTGLSYLLLYFGKFLTDLDQALAL